MDYLYEGHIFKIRQDNTRRNRFYCVMQNPFNPNYDTKVLYGGSVEIVKRKIKSQFVKFQGR